MNTLRLILALTTALAIATIANTSEATTQPAMAGHGWPNHFDTCFGSSWSLMANNCSGPIGSQRLLIIPTQANDGGYYNTIYARASGNGTNGMTNCQGIAVLDTTNGLWGYSFTQIVSTNVSAIDQVLNLGGIYVPPSATMHFECFVAQGGGKVVSINF